MTTEPSDAADKTEKAGAPVQADAASDAAPVPTQHPRGYTMADEELERIEAKRARGNVLDPIALDDPTGQSVEKVILRVGVAVVVVLVAGILLAQVACRNIQLSGITDFSTTQVSGETVGTAVRGGISWGGEIVRFPDDVRETTFDRESATVIVKVYMDTARTVEQLTAEAESQAMALAMNLFRDEGVSTVVYVVQAPVSEDGSYKWGGGLDSYTVDLLTFAWTRSADDPACFSCAVRGFDPVATSLKASVEAQ